MFGNPVQTKQPAQDFYVCKLKQQKEGELQ